MQFILSNGWEEGVADLTKRLIQELSGGKHVLWLVTGGSNLPASVTIMDSISEELSPGLTVMLADERYGEPGHADSNWAQLMQAGFNGKQANLLPILQAGDSFETTRKRYDEMTGKAFADNQLVIAQMGIGTDGHIAGILPHSSAAHETKLLVAAYEAEPYRRLTMTFPALMHISADYSFVFGEGKQLALRALERDSLDPIEFPSQALEKLPEAYIYNDQIGEPK